MKRKLLVLLFSLTSLALTSCGGGNETTSTGSSVTAQATTATVTACNASASFGGAGPLLTDATNPTLEACNAAIAFTCNASVTYGGTEPALTSTTSPSLKTCIAVMNESNPNGGKVLAGRWTFGGGSVYLNTQYVGGQVFGAFPKNVSSPCGFGSTPNQAIISCLSPPSVTQFYSYNLNGATYHSHKLGPSYGVFPVNDDVPCGHGSTPNQAMISCLN